MKYFNWSNIRLVLMFALVVFLFAFTSKRNEQRHLTKSVVLFAGEGNLLVTNEMVNKLLIENNSNAHSIRKDKLDLNKLEKSINKQDMIEKSEVFVSIDGVLKAVVNELNTTTQWVSQHQDEAAKLLEKPTGLSSGILQSSISRMGFGVQPISDEVVKKQQDVADAFYNQKLIPNKINIQAALLAK